MNLDVNNDLAQGLVPASLLAPEGLMIEFGVYRGGTISSIANSNK